MIKTNTEFQKEMEELAVVFYGNDFSVEIVHNEEIYNKLYEKIVVNGENFEFDYPLPEGNQLKTKSIRKRRVLYSLYMVLSKIEKKVLPWGSFTGIRPTALARNLIESGEVKDYLIVEYLQNEYAISYEKALLVSKILKNQKGIIRNDNLVDFYVNIPICPSRCVYCSFISSELSKVNNLVEKYLDCLIKEIKAVRKIITEKSLIVRNVYIGGGTPSVLTAEQLERLLGEVKFSTNEFTVECGRPDTITEEKLDVLKKCGVTRICINPQTFSNMTLKRIGRKHTKEDVFSAYSLAIEKGFKVNMDIIIGLPGEKEFTINKTINTLLDLYPNNLTIHTLSLKRGSDLFFNNEFLGINNIEKILSKAEKTVMNAGYKPYYLYRQKYQLSSLENVGFYRDNDICQFNIDSMEETSTIIAVGAGAITKRVFNLENKIERQANVKFIDDYIKKIDEMIAKKQNLFNL